MKSDEGRGKQRRVIKHYVDWCLQNDLPPLQARRPHIELFVRWCETWKVSSRLRQSGVSCSG